MVRTALSAILVLSLQLTTIADDFPLLSTPASGPSVEGDPADAPAKVRVGDWKPDVVHLQLTVVEVDEVSREIWIQALEHVDARPLAAGDGAVLPGEASERSLLRELSRLGGEVRVVTRPQIQAIVGNHATVDLGEVEQVVAAWNVSDDLSQATPVGATTERWGSISLLPRFTAVGRVSIDLRMTRTFSDDPRPENRDDAEADVFRSSCVTKVEAKSQIDTPFGRTVMLPGLCSTHTDADSIPRSTVGQPNGIMVFLTAIVEEGDRLSVPAS